MKNQINRVRELMGLKVLSEQIGPALTAAQKYIKHVIENGKISKEELEKFSKKTILGDAKLLPAKEAEEILSNLDFSKFTKKLIDNQIVSTQTKNKFFNAFGNSIRKKEKTYKEVINILNNSQYFSDLYNISIGAPKGTAVPNYILKIQEEFNKIFVKDFKNYFYKRFRFGPRNTLLNIEFTGLKGFREIFLNYWWKKKSTLENEIVIILDRIKDKTKNVTDNTTPDAKKIHADVKQLFNLIAGWKKSADDDIGKLINKYIVDNPNIPKEIKDNLMSKGYIGNFVKYLNEDISETTWGVLKEKARAYGQLFDIRKPVNMLKRWGSLISYKSPSFYDDIFTQALRNGKTATLVEKALSLIFIHNFAIPFVLGTMKTLYENSFIIDDRDNMIAIRQLCETGLLQDCPSDEELNNLQHLTDVDWYRNIRESAPVIKLIVGQNGEHKWTDALFFTWWDEVMGTVIDVIKDRAIGWGDKYKISGRKLEEIRKRLELQLTSRGIDPTNPAEIKKLVESLKKPLKTSGSTTTTPPPIPTDSTTIKSDAASLDSFFKKQ